MPALSLVDYQLQAARTADRKQPFPAALTVCGLGVTGEAGELADRIKKIVFHGHPIDREKLLEEAGDVLWYLAFLATVLGSDLGQIGERNLAKLRKRYPEGFTHAASLARVDTEGERNE